MKNDTVNQQNTSKSVSAPAKENHAILALLVKHNPSQSPKVEEFLRAFYEGKKGTCLKILNEGELMITTNTFIDESAKVYKAEITESFKNAFFERFKQLAIERDTYSQFYFSVLDVVAQTPALMAFVKIQISNFTKTMQKAAKRPWRKPGTWGFVTDVLLGLVKILTKKKTRNLISEYLKKVDFKSPFLLMMSQENFPEKFHSLKPYIQQLDAAGKNFAQKREEWEISKMPGATYEDRRTAWLNAKKGEKEKEEKKEHANQINQ